jgi:mycothiol synthase
MITYGWGRDLASRPDVAAMLDEAAAHDAEQGFLSLPGAAAGSADAWELVVRLRRPAGDGGRRRTWVNAAYLRVSPGERGRLVVRPRYRSLGVATSLAERLGTDPTIDGPHLEGLQIWAHGTHPAAERMSRRFGLPADRTEDELIVPMRSARAWWTSAGPAETVEVDADTAGAYVRSVGGVPVGAGAGRVRVAAREGDGTVVGLATAVSGGREEGEATLEYLDVREGHRRRGIGRSLLGALLLRLADAGHRYTRVVVGEKTEIVPLFRAHGFRHDQTNLRFTAGPGPLTARPVARKETR